MSRLVVNSLLVNRTQTQGGRVGGVREGLSSFNDFIETTGVGISHIAATVHWTLGVTITMNIYNWLHA